MGWLQHVYWRFWSWGSYITCIIWWWKGSCFGPGKLTLISLGKYPECGWELWKVSAYWPHTKWARNEGLGGGRLDEVGNRGDKLFNDQLWARVDGNMEWNQDGDCSQNCNSIGCNIHGKQASRQTVDGQQYSTYFGAAKGNWQMEHQTLPQNCI